MIKVYKIQLTNEEIEQLNNEGWGSSNPKIRAYGQRSFGDVDKVDMQFYTHVANVKTYDREDAFRLMNLWEQEDLIELIDGPCASMSVGDVLEMEDGRRFLCASFGFTAI